MKGKRGEGEKWRRGGENAQLPPPFEMFVVVEEIVSALTPRTWIDTAVLTRLRGSGLAEQTGERFEDAVVVMAAGLLG